MGIMAKVIRGVYIRGKGYREGEIVELSGQEFGELLTSHYVVAAPEEPVAKPAEDKKAEPSAPKASK